jgi:uncharacterized pyridoxal phosphate-containing UPF0001 family protein
MNSIVVNLIQVRNRIELAALAAKREPEEIELLAVSKTFPASAVEEAMHAGQSAFGENYVQEGVEKIIQLAKLRPWLIWHFIGPCKAIKQETLPSILIGFIVWIGSKLQSDYRPREANFRTYLNYNFAFK